MATGFRAKGDHFEPAPPPVLPRDTWVGPTFVEADGTEYESTWSGRGALPGHTGRWPEGPAPSLRTIAARHGVGR